MELRDVRLGNATLAAHPDGGWALPGGGIIHCQIEAMAVAAELDALIGQGAPLDALRRHAQLQGFAPLADAARALALSGRTSLDEALRVVDLPPHRADED